MASGTQPGKGDAAVHVQLVDEISIQGPAGTVAGDRLPGAQPRTTFAYLVLHRDVGVPLDRLGEVVWGANRPETWRPALRSLASKVRTFVTTAVPTATLTSGQTGYVLQLTEPVEVDVEQARHAARLAEQALQASQVEEAVDHAARVNRLAIGAFLPRSESPWARGVAEEMEALRLRTLHVLAEAHIARGDPARASRTAQEAIDLAPLHEGSHRLAMRALATAGETAGAAQAFARCRQLLRDELGVNPSPQTTELLTTILRS